MFQMILLVSHCWCSAGNISGHQGVPSIVCCFMFLLQGQLSLPEGWEILLAENKGAGLKRGLGTELLSSFIKGALWMDKQAYCIGF